MPKFVAPLIGGMAETVGAITADSLTLTTKLAIAQGGTGASSAASARSNLGLGNINSTWEQQILPTVLHRNLGAPSVLEAAMISTEVANRIWFYDPAKIMFEESIDNEVTWTPKVVNTSIIKDLVSGNSSTSISMMKGIITRITIAATSYCYLNWLYFYYSTSGDSVSVKLDKRLQTTQIWSAVTAYEAFNTWPGHIMVPHAVIPFAASGAGKHDAVRITFKANADTTSGVYPVGTIYGLEWWGGYPAAGKRTVYSWDALQNVAFPAAITAASLALTTKLAVAQGGTGVATAPVPGGVIYGASATAYDTSAAGTTGQVLKSAGAGKPTWGALTKSDVGLPNVDNTTDAAKPVSTAQQTALNLKADDAGVTHKAGTETVTGAKTFSAAMVAAAIAAASLTLTTKLAVAQGGTGVATAPVPGGVIYGANAAAYGTTLAGTTGQVLRSAGAGAPTWGALAKSDVGLSNVDNTTDLAKPVSTAQLTALNLKVDNTDVIAVDHGGTGVVTAPTPGGVIYGASALTYGTTLVGTAGQVLKSAGAGKPVWADSPGPGVKWVDDGVVPPDVELYDGAIVAELTSGKIWAARWNGTGYDHKFIQYPWSFCAYTGVDAITTHHATWENQYFSTYAYAAEDGYSFNSSAADLVGGQLVIPATGIYTGHINVMWAADDVGQRCVEVLFNNPALGLDGMSADYRMSVLSALTFTKAFFNRYLDAGTTIHAGLFQSSGGDLSATMQIFVTRSHIIS